MAEEFRVEFHDDPRKVLAIAADFLASEPVRHNLVHTLLRRVARTGDEGRYWVAHGATGVVGITFQSPLRFFATLTPMPQAAVVTTVERVAADGVELPGIHGEVEGSSVFAGRWTECTRSAARPAEALRLYEVDEVTVPTAPGRVRPATDADRDLAAGWLQAFEAEIREPTVDAEVVAFRRIAAGELWIHDDRGPVSITGVTAPTAGAVRVGPVYTPPERRGHGYASALVAERAAVARAEGLRCLLYTQLANPTSNAIYRAIGFAPVAELMRYEFDAPRP